jgi:hypothetical protein
MNDVFEWVYNGNTHYGKPWRPIPIEDDPNYGKPFWEAVGMSQEEADVVIAEYHKFHLRLQRDIKLKETDWVSGEDVPQSIKDMYFPYRQALRDITDTYSSLADVVWPTKP